MPKGVPLQFAVVHVPKQPAGPPPRTKLEDSPDEMEIIFNCIASGGSLRKAAAAVRRDQITVWKALTGERHAPAYAHARALRATHTADELVDVNQALWNGEVDPNAARVISGNLQWLAERQDGRRWGSKSQMEVKAEVGLTVNVIRRTDPIGNK